MNPRRAALLPLLFAASCRPAGNSGDATGTVELTETDIAPLTAARVLRVLVDEGATVRLGDTLVVLSQSGLPPELDSRRARVTQMQAELRDLRAGARAPELARAGADVAAATEDAERARKDADRYRVLLQSGSVGQAQADAYETAARVAAERVVNARASARLLEDGTRPDRIRAAESALRQSRAQVASLEAAAGDLVLLAPHDGVVLGRHVEPGETIAAGVSALSLGDPRHPWVRVYVAPSRFEQIQVGDRARVHVVGGAGDYGATVVALSTRAEFTPRVAMTETERADLLFGVKLTVADSTGRVKAGLPVTVSFGGAGSRASP